VAQFNKGTYTIYQQKETPGDGPLSPESPKNEIATSGHNLGRSLPLIAAGTLVMQSALSMSRTEIGATTGNEVLQAGVNNAITGFAYAAGIAAGGWPIALALGIKSIADETTRQRGIYRANVAVSMENKLRGRRVSIGKGSVYYD
jgi:hypothetical protein